MELFSEIFVVTLLHWAIEMVSVVTNFLMQMNKYFFIKQQCNSATADMCGMVAVW